MTEKNTVAGSEFLYSLVFYGFKCLMWLAAVHVFSIDPGVAKGGYVLLALV
jgi:hypothetical protein